MSSSDEDTVMSEVLKEDLEIPDDKHIFPDAIARQIGEVVDGMDGNMKRPILNGNEYDYVFDVSTGKDKLILKFPYNRSDDAYETADKWLKEQELLPTYRQLVADFIREIVSGSGAPGTVHGEPPTNVLQLDNPPAQLTLLQMPRDVIRNVAERLTPMELFFFRETCREVWKATGVTRRAKIQPLSMRMLKKLLAAANRKRRNAQ